MFNRKNTVYFISSANKLTGTYIAARNLNSVKKLGKRSKIIGDYIKAKLPINIYTPLVDGRLVFTSFEGELSTEEIVSLNLAWWSCDNKLGKHQKPCGCKNFDVFTDTVEVGLYKCKKCGHTAKIPYSSIIYSI